LSGLTAAFAAGIDSGSAIAVSSSQVALVMIGNLLIFLECARSIRREHNDKAMACYLAVQHLCLVNPDVSSTITTAKTSHRGYGSLCDQRPIPFGFKAGFRGTPIT
jgi:hypothetical protein